MEFLGFPDPFHVKFRPGWDTKGCTHSLAGSGSKAANDNAFRSLAAHSIVVPGALLAFSTWV